MSVPETRQILLMELQSDVPELLRPAAYLFAGQLLGLYTGLKKGLDPDNPRNLSRVVVLGEEESTEPYLQQKPESSRMAASCGMAFRNALLSVFMSAFPVLYELAHRPSRRPAAPALTITAARAYQRPSIGNIAIRFSNLFGIRRFDAARRSAGA